jgi:hypothetical protein
MTRKTWGLIAVALSIVWSGLLVLGGFRLHLVVIEHNPLFQKSTFPSPLRERGIQV